MEHSNAEARARDAAAGGDRLGSAGACDDNALCVRSFHVRAVRSEAEGRYIDVVASTNREDSYEEVVEQDWILDDYRENPVVLWAHQSRELPLGRGSDIDVIDGKLCARIWFASEKANPKAEHVYRL